MSISDLAWPAVALAVLGAVVLLVSIGWRLRLVALSSVYLGVFGLALLSLPIERAAVKLVAGWMVVGILAMAAPQKRIEDDKAARNAVAPGLYLVSGRIFRLIAAALVALIVTAVLPGLLRLAPGVQEEQAWGGLLLAGFGILQLGLTGRTLRTVFGLLVTLAGMETLYAALESSALMVGLLGTIHLAIALAGSYLLAAPGMERVE